MKQIYLKAYKSLNQELSKLSNKKIKSRINNDKSIFIRFVAFNISSRLSLKERKLISKSQLLKYFSATVSYNLSIRIIFRLIKCQFLLILKWIRLKNKLRKVKILIINNINDELYNHLKNNNSYNELQLIIPLRIILFKRFIFTRNYSLNEDLFGKKIKKLDFDILKLYNQRVRYYLMCEEIGNLLANFVKYIEKYQFIKSIEILSSYQSYLENHFLKKHKNKNFKKLEGISIALHGGIYCISYGYPIMFYQFEEDLELSPKYLMPREFFRHFSEDLNFYLDKNQTSSNILKEQYGFPVLKEPKSTKFLNIQNNDLYIFANNLLPHADPYMRSFSEFDIKNSFIRWKKINDIWSKGKVFIVVRSKCYKYLITFYSNELSSFNLILLKNQSQIRSSFMIFEGLSSAIREHILFGKFALVFLPKKAFLLSKHNILEQKEIVNKNKFKIIRNQSELFSELELLEALN